MRWLIGWRPSSTWKCSRRGLTSTATAPTGNPSTTTRTRTARAAPRRILRWGPASGSRGLLPSSTSRAGPSSPSPSTMATCSPLPRLRIASSSTACLGRRGRRPLCLRALPAGASAAASRSSPGAAGGPSPAPTPALRSPCREEALPGPVADRPAATSGPPSRPASPLGGSTGRKASRQTTAATKRTGAPTPRPPTPGPRAAVSSSRSCSRSSWTKTRGTTRRTKGWTCAPRSSWSNSSPSSAAPPWGPSGEPPTPTRAKPPGPRGGKGGSGGGSGSLHPVDLGNTGKKTGIAVTIPTAASKENFKAMGLQLRLAAVVFT
mmetsp:Transcript_9956/g.22877  ORF Transcript_9956/g.22877 Transcript_9956/m.22877 type:complete len:320 (+) Transcript_9956:503-1462(+)